MLMFRLGSKKTCVEADWEAGSNFCCKTTEREKLVLQYEVSRYFRKIVVWMEIHNVKEM